MALAANSARIYEVDSFINDQPVLANAVIYLGSAVGSSGGYARALVAQDVFMGFALEAVTGTATSGAVRVAVRKKGYVKLAITSVAVTDYGKLVYASDDGTFTLTSTSNSTIGRISRWISTGLVIVAFDADNTTLAL